MKMKFLVLASIGLAVGAAAAAAGEPATPNAKNASTQPFPTLQLPVFTDSESWITNSWLGADNESLVQPAHIEGEYWVSDGKRICVRSEYTIKQDLSGARRAYLAHDPKCAVADLLKASLLLQEDMVLARPKMREELRGAAIEVEHEAEMVSEVAAPSARQMNVASREARRAADEFDYARFGGV
jgi:hypothetical protein